jgi:hypothetical protein
LTKCLRGVTGNAVDANGQPLIDCQCCHGPMSSVAKSGRTGWLDEPDCQSRHDRATAGGAFMRYTIVFASATTPRNASDRLFAIADNAPTAGKSPYRSSTGHGGWQCEACHGSTHAEYPSSHANDTVRLIALQGQAGTLRERTPCHAAAPVNGVDGGPHGMHVIGRDWQRQHQHVG